MKIVYSIVMVAALFFSTSMQAHADIIPPEMKNIEVCAKIINLSSFPHITLVGETLPVQGGAPIYTKVTSGACIYKEGYKLNTFMLYAVDTEDLGTSSLEEYMSTGKKIPVTPMLTGERTTYVAEASDIVSQEVQYKVLGVYQGKVELFATRKSTVKTSGDEDVQILTRPMETMGITYAESVDGVVAPKEENGSVAPMPFTDVRGHFSQEYVEVLYAKGIVQGRSATVFAPDAQMNRAEALKMILRAFYTQEHIMTFYTQYREEHKDFTYSTFQDVPVASWFAPYVQKAVSLGVLDTSKSVFRAGDEVTRAEFLKMVMAVALQSTFEKQLGSTMEGLTVLPLPAEAKDELLASYFSDVPKEGWFTDVVCTAANEGIINKAPLFFPQRSVTRGEASKMVAKALQTQ